LRTKYFYYVCRSKECSLSVSADEVETAVLERIKYLASSDVTLQQITEETNTRLLRQKPILERQRQVLLKSLVEVKKRADRLLDNLSGLEEKDGAEFVKEKLGDLACRRKDLEAGIAEVEKVLQQINDQTVDIEIIRNALARIDEVYSKLKPFERRELMSLVLKSARVNEREIILEIYALGEQTKPQKTGETDEKVRLLPIWLPELVNRQNFQVGI
jgi:hypothetical protein